MQLAKPHPILDKCRTPYGIPGETTSFKTAVSCQLSRNIKIIYIFFNDQSFLTCCKILNRAFLKCGIGWIIRWVDEIGFNDSHSVI